VRWNAVAHKKIAGLAGKAADNFARYTEKVMFRNASIAMLSAAILLEPTVSVQAAEYATAQEAKALLVKAVAAVKEDEAKALNIFQAGTDGFKDRDLYVWCANVSNGILTAHPTNKGKDLRKIVGKKGSPFGREIMQKADGKMREITYWWPRPGSDVPHKKTTFYTKVGDQICGTGYYKQ
jgi:hypothetical protein